MAKIYSWLDTADGGFVPPQAQTDANGDPVPAYIYLCVIDGVHYGAIADGVTMPSQKKKTQLQGPLSFKTDAAIFARLRKEAMPCKEINANLSQVLRARYSLEDELQALRGNDPDYKAFVQGLVDGARAEKSMLGLYPSATANKSAAL